VKENEDIVVQELIKQDAEQMQLVERIQLKYSEKLQELCRLSQELYNKANKIIHQGFHMFVLHKSGATQKAGKWIRYETLYHEMKDDPAYRALPSQTAQQTLKLLEENWTSFFEAIKAWKKVPSKFEARPKPPGVKAGERVVVFTNQQARIKCCMKKCNKSDPVLQNCHIKHYLYFPKKVGLPPVRVNGDRIKHLNQVRIFPMNKNVKRGRNYYYMLEIVYQKAVVPLGLDTDRMLALDLGVNNIVACVSNVKGLRPFLVKGGPIKHINQYYNKLRAKLQKKNSRHGIKYQTRRSQQLDRKRNNKIDDLFHKLTRALIAFCIGHNIGTVVIGYNEKWKQRANMGRKNNQNFVDIPFHQLVQKITYKAKLVGIQVVRIEESHTSKCSFLDNEPIQHHDQYLGRRGVYRNGRLCRGLFKTKDGNIINSDINGASNILRKAFPKALRADGIEGLGLVPYSVKISELNRSDNLNSSKMFQRGVA